MKSKLIWGYYQLSGGEKKEKNEWVGFLRRNFNLF